MAGDGNPVGVSSWEQSSEQLRVAGMGWTHLSDCGTTPLLLALLRKVTAVSSR